MVMSVSPAKKDEAIKMLFGQWTHVDQEKMSYMGTKNHPMERGTFEGYYLGIPRLAHNRQSQPYSRCGNSDAASG